MPTNPIDLDARLQNAAVKRRQERPFGAPSPLSRAHSTPTVSVPYLPLANSVIERTGRSILYTESITGEPQEGSPTTRVTRLMNTTTKQVRDVDSHEATLLLRQGWVPLDVVNARPSPPKPYGKL